MGKFLGWGENCFGNGVVVWGISFIFGGIFVGTGAGAVVGGVRSLRSLGSLRSLRTIVLGGYSP